MGSVWLIASGKGGVGKSTVSAGTATALNRMGSKVCIVDADIGLKCQDTILGVENNVVYDLMDVARKGCSIRQALIRVPEEENLRLLAASQFARAKDLEPKVFDGIVKDLRDSFDHVIIDCPAGLERNLRILTQCHPDHTVVVLTPDDVSIQDAKRLCAFLTGKELPRPQLVVNRLIPELVRAKEMLPAKAAAIRLSYPLLGEIPDDRSVYRALINHIRVMDVDCEVRSAMIRIAKRMRGEKVAFPEYGSEKPSLLSRLRFRRMKEVRTIDR